MSAVQRRLFCFGLGFTAQALARRLIVDGWRIAGTSRNPKNAADGEIALFSFNRGQPLSDAAVAALAGATHVLASIPPDDIGDVGLDGYGDIIAAAAPAWIGYLSTTGVYGDRGGALVDENSSPRPISNRACRRLAAENAWVDFAAENNLPVQIFRLAGIYGPGRSALGRVRGGTAQRVDRPGQLFGRIHVDDIVKVVIAAMKKPFAGPVFNVCDDKPAEHANVIAYACELLGSDHLPLVPYEEAVKTMSPMAKSFWRDNRVVNNGRIKSELGVDLSYPTYREGLRAVLQVEEGI
jgi:nucleoside-diphosphate-sugar epimerase